MLGEVHFDEVQFEKSKEPPNKTRSNQNDLLDMVEENPLLMCSFLPNFTLTYVNRAYCNFFQKEPSQLIGTDFTLLIPPEERDEVTKSLKSLTPNSPRQRHEHRVFLPDGSEAWHQWSNWASFDSSGNLTKYIGTGEDITELRSTEEELFLLKSIVDQSLDGLAAVDLSGNLIYLNPAFAKLHGYEPDELIGKNLSIFHNAEQIEDVEAANKQIKATGHFYGVVWHTRKDGTVFPGLMNNSLILDPDNKPICMVGTLRDITELKQIETDLKESEQYLKHILKHAPVGIGFGYLDGSYSYLNCNMIDLFGYNDNEDEAHKMGVLGARDVTHPDDKQSLAFFDKLISGEIDHYNITKKYLRKDGSSFIGHASVGIIDNAEDQQKTIMIIVEDVTELHKFQEKLSTHNDMLEEKVKERTVELEKLNTALQVLLDHREKEKKLLMHDIASTAAVRITPFVDRLRKSKLDQGQMSLVDMIDKAIKELIAPYSKGLTLKLSGLTPREKEIALLIRDGLTNAEIADALNVSEHTVAFHRQNIRKKLGVNQGRTNLISYLREGYEG